jgi:hypothetical protein
MSLFPPSSPDQPVANPHLDHGELASGIDALYLSGHGKLRTETLEELEYQRDLAEVQLPTTARLGPLPFAESPWVSWRLYRTQGGPNFLDTEENTAGAKTPSTGRLTAYPPPGQSQFDTGSIRQPIWLSGVDCSMANDVRISCPA